MDADKCVNCGDCGRKCKKNYGNSKKYRKTDPEDIGKVENDKLLWKCLNCGQMETRKSRQKCS